jgi:molybdopterin-binding protein
VGNQTLATVITADALSALKLQRGDDAIAIVKSTEVMIATSCEHRNAERRKPRRKNR